MPNLGLIGAYGAAAGGHALQEILKQRALDIRLQQEQAMKERMQAAAEARDAESRRQFEIGAAQRDRAFDLQSREFEASIKPKPLPPVHVQNIVRDGKVYQGQRDPRTNLPIGQDEEQYVTPTKEPAGTEYTQALGRFATRLGKKVDDLTQAEEDAFNKKYHELDNPPQRGFAPLIVPYNGGLGVASGDRTKIKPVVDADTGQPAGFAPTSAQRDRQAQIGGVGAFMQSVNELSERINVNQGVYAKAKGEVAKQAAKVNLDDDVAEYEATVEAFTPLWARALGHTGVLTQQDVDSARAALPQPGNSKSLRDRKIARIMKIMGALPGGDVMTGRAGTDDAAGGDELDAAAWLANRNKKGGK